MLHHLMKADVTKQIKMTSCFVRTHNTLPPLPENAKFSMKYFISCIQKVYTEGGIK